MEVEQTTVRACSYQDLKGDFRHLSYCLLEEQVEDETGERMAYGIAVREQDGDCCALRDLSSRRAWTLALLEQLAHSLVTPVTLRDVVEDLL